MHKTEETAKESRLNFMYSHLRNRTLAEKVWAEIALKIGVGLTNIVWLVNPDRRRAAQADR